MVWDGTGIFIGQVEASRVGKSGTDTVGNSNASIVPHSIFLESADAVSDELSVLFSPEAEQTEAIHATAVASVLISTDATDDPANLNNDAPLGVSPGASLVSAGIDNANGGDFPYLDDFRFALQHVATRNGGDVRAMNLSFQVPERNSNTTDGNSPLTKFVDWSAREHNTLYAVAGNQGRIGLFGRTKYPTDNFNGVTVFSSTTDTNGVYRKVASFNEFHDGTDAVGPRTSPDILAPGEGFDIGLLGGGEENLATGNTLPGGNSFAAPHVTGTVALLQEFGDERIITGAANWGGLFNGKPTARRHEVMKAVLVNSADKLKDTGDGLRLGMTRTVEKKDGSTWLQSAAASNVSVPLDEEMGAGHLNADRAIAQFASGEVKPTSISGLTVPQIGWDYSNTLDTPGAFWNEYEFGQPLRAGSYVSITATWDRLVDLDVADGTFNSGDTFTAAGGGGSNDGVGFNDNDIYLLPAGATDISEALPGASSVSGDSNTEHLFFQIPTAGMYEFWIYEFDSTIDFNGSNYAVAWWADSGPVVNNPGDFDGDGIVNQGDYVAWRDSFGQSVTPGSGADANNNGLIDAADYTVWRDAFAAVSVSVPEPSSLLLFLAAITCGFSARADRSTA